LNWRLAFPWISLDSLVRNVSFQWVTGDLRRENFFAVLSPELTASIRWR
jgi:hypothetical protein